MLDVLFILRLILLTKCWMSYLFLEGCPEPGIAARLADAYVLNGTMGWHIPSKDELNLMYLNIGHLMPAYGNYVSSSELRINSSWNQDFSSGAQREWGKSYPSALRPIRAF